MSISIHPINTGFFYLDGGAMFGVVPKVIWQKFHRPDKKNRIRQALRSHLVIDGERKFLIDVGIGDWHNEKFNDIYSIEYIRFDEQLKKHHLSCEDITDVILTHLHFDHAGGIITKTRSELDLTFPNANIWVQKKHWHWANGPSEKDRASFKGEYLEILNKTSQLNFIDGRKYITDNIEVIPFDGHTIGLQAVLIKTDSQPHFLPSDLLPNVSHAHVPFIMAYDNDPTKTVDEKKLFLPQAQKENWIIHFYHDPEIEQGEVEFKENKFSIRK